MAVYAGPDIVENGLVLHLDAANPRSYPGTGTGWFDLSGNNNHFQIFNSPQFSRGYFILDGIDDNISSINNIDLTNTNLLTIQYVVRILNYSTVKVLFELSSNFNSFVNTFGSFYADTSQPNNPVPMGNIGALGSYNYADYSRTLYDDLKWKFCNWVQDKRITPGSPQNIFYIQGSQQTPTGRQISNGNTANFASDKLYIASRGGAAFYANVELSSFSIYSRILSNDEIKQNYNAMRGRFNI
jgi:hypothetical protein